MSGDFASLACNQLQWLPDVGVGFLDIERDDLYGEAYFENYRELDRTPMAKRLNDARLRLVERHWKCTSQMVDIGIGGGSFMDAADCHGWDINPRAQHWLREHERLIDPRVQRVRAATFWDSIEHIRDPSIILANVERWAFVSTPTYASANAARGSKHFKPGEHLWYFTERGIVRFMHEHGFRLRESNLMESDIGRDGIGSFAFERA